MIATWAGRSFDIAGAAADADPDAPWQFLSEAGRPMTPEQFDDLPQDGQAWLREAVALYVSRSAA